MALAIEKYVCSSLAKKKSQLSSIILVYMIVILILCALLVTKGSVPHLCHSQMLTLGTPGPNRFLLFADAPLLDFTVPKQTSKTLHTTTLQCQHTNQNTQEFLSNVFSFSSESCKITMMKTTTSSSVRTARAPAQMINGSPATSRHRISLVITALLL